MFNIYNVHYILGQLVNFQEFQQAVTSNGFPSPSWNKYNSFASRAQSDGNIASKQEAAMVLAHVLQETGGLQHLREIACQQNQCAGQYQCSSPGSWCQGRNCDRPGQYYFGRGYMQLSWCANYQAASIALLGDERLLDNPDMVAEDEGLAWGTAFWYWKANVRNRPGVLDGKFGESTRAINPMECVPGNQQKESRFRYYGNIRRAFGLQGNGDPSGC